MHNKYQGTNTKTPPSVLLIFNYRYTTYYRLHIFLFLYAIWLQKSTNAKCISEQITFVYHFLLFVLFEWIQEFCEHPKFNINIIHSAKWEIYHESQDQEQDDHHTTTVLKCETNRRMSNAATSQALKLLESTNLSMWYYGQNDNNWSAKLQAALLM